MGKLSQIVVDCRHPGALARFWAAALDGFEILPYDDDEIARLHGSEQPEATRLLDSCAAKGTMALTVAHASSRSRSLGSGVVAQESMRRRRVTVWGSSCPLFSNPAFWKSPTVPR